MMQPLLFWPLEINRDESVQVSAIMRDGYEEIEVPLSLDDNTIAEIKDAVKENVEQSLDVSVQHFFETAEPNHNYSQEEVHALAETVGKFVTAYRRTRAGKRIFSGKEYSAYRRGTYFSGNSAQTYCGTGQGD